MSRKQDAGLGGESPGVLKRKGQPPETLDVHFKWLPVLLKFHPGYPVERVTFHESPWTPLAKPLSECRIALVTTAGVYVAGQPPFEVRPPEEGGPPLPGFHREHKYPERGDHSFRVIPGDVRAEDLRVANRHMPTEAFEADVNCVFPVERLAEIVREGLVGEVAPVHAGLMGYIPDVRPLIEETVPEVVQVITGARADAALLTPGCVEGHWSLGLIQRALEEAGVSTVSVSVVRDLSEMMTLPRVVSPRFPIGNPLGRAGDRQGQRRVLWEALRTLEERTRPGEIVDLPYPFDDPPAA